MANNDQDAPDLLEGQTYDFAAEVTRPMMRLSATLSAREEGCVAYKCLTLKSVCIDMTLSHHASPDAVRCMLIALRVRLDRQTTITPI